MSYSYKQWTQDQTADNVIHASDLERWQDGITDAGGTWEGSWTDEKDTLTAEQLNALETEIASLYGTGFTAKTWEDGQVPGVDEWNRIEDAINTILNRTAFAIYCETDNSLTFYVDTEVPEVGDTYEGKAVTAVYTGLESTNFTSNNTAPWETAYADDITSVAIDRTFSYCKPNSLARWFENLANAVFTGLGNFNLSGCTQISYMFYGCSSLTSLSGVENWDTSKVTTLAYALQNCSSLTSLSGVENWDVSKVTTFTNAFRATAITNLDPLAKWDISSATDMTSAFYECTKLQTANLPGLNAASLTTLTSTFYGCTALTEADLSWSAAALTTLQNLFYNSTSLVTVNLAGIDTANVTNMSSTFRNCSKLETVYVSEGQFNTDKVTSDTNMFASCTSIVGGNGTTFDSSKIDSSMAHIDTADNPGYFTAKG